MIVHRFVCALCIGLCLASTGAGATGYLDRPLEQRLARADRVVLARVASTRVERGEGERPRLMTVVELEVEETLKGAPAPGRSILLRQLGGAADGWSAQLPGAPTFEPNARAVFLLRCQPLLPGSETPSCALAGLRDALLPVVPSSGRADVLLPSVANSHTERMTLDDLRALARGAKSPEVGRAAGAAPVKKVRAAKPQAVPAPVGVGTSGVEAGR